jgi:hypothetical protein
MSNENHSYNNEEGNLSRTAHFTNDYKEPKEQLSYFREMEDNLKLFEMKLKKLEKNTFGPETNNNYHNQNNLSNDNPAIGKQNYPTTPNRVKPAVDTPEPKYDNLINELRLKNNLIADLTAKLENSKHDDLIEDLQREIRIKDNECKKVYDENDRLKLIIESLRKENNNLKTSYAKTEKENSSLMTKIHEMDKDNKLLAGRANSNDSVLKNLKFDYDNIFKNFSVLKKQYEAMTEKMEELKANNHNLLQDRVISEAKKPLINTSENIGRYSYNFEDTAGIPSNKKTFNAKKTNYENIKVHTPNDIVEFPSEYKVKSQKNELLYIESRLTELGKEKVHVENNLFKLPTNPRTLNDINKKKEMEASLQDIEDKITELKMRLRQLNRK